MNGGKRVGPRAERPGLSYVKQIFSLMYPDADVSLRRAPGGRNAHAWVLIPTYRNPALLVPTTPARASRASLDEIQRRGSRLLTGIMRLAAASRVLNLLPRLTVSVASDRDLHSLIAASLARREVALSLVVGRTRALQKPVLRVLAHDGTPLGFAKVGFSDITRSLVRHEISVLCGFESNSPVHFRTPSVLGAEESGELSVLIQEPLPGVEAPEIDVVTSAAIEISQRGGTATTPLRGTVFWRELQNRVMHLPEGARFARELVRTLEHIERDRSDVEVHVGSWHGDYAPWNMGWDGARLSIWDWEGFAGDVPCGFDMLHHRFQGDVVVAGRHPESAFHDLLEAAPSLLSPWAQQDPQLIVGLYLLHLVTGLIETADMQTRISRLDDWLGSALAALTHQESAK